MRSSSGAQDSGPGAGPGGGEEARAVLAHLRHELRTPLNAIIGYSEMLLEVAQEDGNPDADIYARIRTAGKQLLERVNRALDPSRLDPMSTGIDLAPFAAALRRELADPLDDVLDLSATLLERAARAGGDGPPQELENVLAAARTLLSLVDHVEELASPRTPEAPAPQPLPTQALAQAAVASLRAPVDITFPGLERPTGQILVVDDVEANRDLLCRRLKREGHTVWQAADGREALSMIAALPFDLVLLDIMMPVLNGYQVLEQLKADTTLFRLPVIVLSALDELDSVVRCVEMGAEDYLTKPFNPILLRARIGACLEKRRLRERESQIFQAMLRSQKQLAGELGQAAAYVRSLLPPPSTGTVTTDWRFIPSSRLGGDAFGYEWLDADHMAIYLLDVCGHGVAAALLSISAMNVLRSRSLPGTDFRDPGQVLCGLNEMFPMERQNGQYFTIWYGVYNRSQRRLAYASGGHPPAVLLTGAAADTAAPVHLRTRSPIIGGLPGMVYRAESCELGPFAQLYVFSDGAYELTRPDAEMLTFAEFVDLLARPSPPGQSRLDRLLSDLRSLHGSDAFEDDVSIVEAELG